MELKESCVQRGAALPLKSSFFFFYNLAFSAETHVTNSAIPKCITHLIETFNVVALLKLSGPVVFYGLKILLKKVSVCIYVILILFTHYTMHAHIHDGLYFFFVPAQHYSE